MAKKAVKKSGKLKPVKISPMGEFWDFTKNKIFIGKFLSEKEIQSKFDKKKMQKIYTFEQYDANGHPLDITYSIGGAYAIDQFLNFPYGKSKKEIKKQDLILMFELVEQKKLKGGRKVNIFETSVLA